MLLLRGCAAHVRVHAGYIGIASAHGVGSLAAGIILYAMYVAPSCIPA